MQPFLTLTFAIIFDPFYIMLWNFVPQIDIFPVMQKYFDLLTLSFDLKRFIYKNLISPWILNYLT